jgi:hypothetical protein
LFFRQRANSPTLKGLYEARFPNFHPGGPDQGTSGTPQTFIALMLLIASPYAKNRLFRNRPLMCGPFLAFAS